MATDLRNDLRNDPQLSQEPRLAEIVSGIVSDAENLVKQQLALFKTEVKDDIHKARNASIPLVGGIFVAALGTVLIAFGIVYLLGWAFPAVPLWVWFLVVGVVLAASGFALFWVGKTRFESIHPLPDKSADALKENVQWFMNPKG